MTLPNDPAYRTLAGQALDAFPLSAHRLGPLAATYAYAVDLHLNGTVHVVIAGKATDPRTTALRRSARGVGAWHFVRGRWRVLSGNTWR